MEVDREQENFYRLFSLLNECVVPQLQKLFLNAWEAKFPTNPWYNSSDNPSELLNLDKKLRRDNLVKERVSKGNVDDWDFTCVSKALSALYGSGLEADCIDKLRNARNKISHLSSGKVNDKEKDEIFIEVKNVYDDLAWPKDAVKKFEHEPLTTEYVKQLQAKLDDERRAGNLHLKIIAQFIGFFIASDVCTQAVKQFSMFKHNAIHVQLWLIDVLLA